MAAPSVSSATVTSRKAGSPEEIQRQEKPVRIEAEGWYARILQHEIDHLKGLYISIACGAEVSARSTITAGRWPF